VTINLVSLSSCVPEWRSGIKINGDEYDGGDTRETAAGEELSFEVKVKGEYKNYRVEWSANPPSAIAFVNPWSLSTKGYVAKDYSGKNPVVKIVLISENGERRREKTVNLIVKKIPTPAALKSESVLQLPHTHLLRFRLKDQRPADPATRTAIISLSLKPG